MTPMEVRNIIMNRYLVEFDGVYNISIDNKRFSEEISWVRLSVNFNDGEQTSLGKIGNRRYTDYGIIFVQVFTPSNEGTDLNDTMANDSKLLFDGVSIGDLTMYNGKVRTIGRVNEFYQQNAVIEFNFLTIR